MTSRETPTAASPAPAERLRAGTALLWLVVIAALLALTTLPTLAVPALVDGPTPVLVALCATPAGPALAAALFAWRRLETERDLTPARAFWRGYRLNVADALRLWVPCLVVLVLLGLNVANLVTSDEAPAVFRVVGLLAAVVVTAWVAHAMLVTSLFSFRARDIMRIAVFFLVTKPLASLGALAVVAAGAAATWWGGVWLLVALAAPLTWLLWRNGRPLAAEVQRRFVVGGTDVQTPQWASNSEGSEGSEGSEDTPSASTDSTPAP